MSQKKVFYGATLMLAAVAVLVAACGSSAREPFTDEDATTDAASDGKSEASVAVEGGSDDCSGVKCRPDQVCLERCSATEPDPGSCFLNIEPTRVCVDLPSGCKRASACNCAPYTAQCPTSGRGVAYCDPDGVDAIKCTCACRF